jgi:hypothetical protein
MKILSLMAQLRRKPQKETTKMSDYVQIHKPLVERTIHAHKAAIARLHECDTRIAALEALDAEHRATIEALSRALMDLLGEGDAGGSTGGVV